MRKYVIRYTALTYLALVLVLPLSMILFRTFQDGLAPVWAALTDPLFLSAFKLTMIAVLIAVPLNTVFGVLCAIALVRRESNRGEWFFNSAIGLPLALSPIVVGLSLILVYGNDGWIGSWLADFGIQIIFSTPGIVLATIFVTLPFVVREVIPVLREIGTDQEEAAWVLGASTLADLPPDHAPVDPLGRRVRRRSHHGAGARRVRRGRRRVGSPRRKDGNAYPSRRRAVPALQRGRCVHDIARPGVARRQHSHRDERLQAERAQGGGTWG